MDSAERIVGDSVTQPSNLGEIPMHEADREAGARFLGYGNDVATLPATPCHRFLQQHRLARLQSFDRQWQMGGVGRRNHHCIHVGVGQHVAVCGAVARNAELGRPPRSSLQTPTNQRRDRAAAGGPNPVDVVVADEAGTDDGDVDLFRGHLLQVMPATDPPPDQQRNDAVRHKVQNTDENDADNDHINISEQPGMHDHEA